MQRSRSALLPGELSLILKGEGIYQGNELVVGVFYKVHKELLYVGEKRNMLSLLMPGPSYDYHPTH